MADISEFSQRAAIQFCESQEGIEEQFNLKLPGAAVENLIKTVFYASMVADEGRYPAVCLMSYRWEAGREFHIPFSPPREPTVQEVAKLAHAVAPSSHLCVVCEQGKPLLAGVHVTMLDEMRQFGYASFGLGNPLKLLIRGPGHIEVSSGGIAFVFRAGDIFEERPLQYADVMKALAASVGKEFEDHTTGVIESLEDIFNDLAEAIVRLGHGGLLLITRNHDSSQYSSERPVDCRLLRHLLIRYWNDVATLLASRSGTVNRLAEVNQQAVGLYALAVSTDTAMLENCVRSIAQLAGMDGAIVMDYGCNVVAFNAIISRDADDAAPAQLVDEMGRELDPAEVGRNRGSRHQSAMSFARRVPNSFAFVISQDGGVTAFHNRGDGTVRWEGGLRILD